ncbi:carbohydrate ABC transporter permease [Alicyclobacillus fastidiosus]|uniref:Carbohydrate ABC transporter permease n=1 Tax=Alicyclobacillus fastidiosus TaxID=392011 RepID=A0ABV5AK44_9BACL|nr:carbohydrate ABC transporter permease [Alicyclobacillus fastidiosus]WEH08351.1 carbohydrate ABC transporter permease [Alicyclobacillus fastidiosus]
MKTKFGHLVAHIILIIGSVIMVIPFIWMILAALKPNSEMASPNWIPHDFDWGNFATVWHTTAIAIWFRNSIIVTLCAVAGQIITSALAGYAFSKMKFHGKNFIFFAILGAMMIPIQAIIVPLYMELAGLHWTNSLIGLIVPMIPSAFGTFLFKQFFDDIPRELEEAAFMDGAKRLKILTKIFIPLSKPVISAFGILSFLFNWNNFFYALIVVTSTKVQTIPVGLSSFQSGNVSYVNLEMAASTMAIVPVLIVFILLQRYFVQSQMMSGIK